MTEIQMYYACTLNLQRMQSNCTIKRETLGEMMFQLVGQEIGELVEAALTNSPFAQSTHTVNWLKRCFNSSRLAKKTKKAPALPI